MDPTTTSNQVGLHLVTTETAHWLDRVDDDVFDHPVQRALVSEFLANPMNHLVVAVVNSASGAGTGDLVIGMASAISFVHPDKPLQLFINEVGVTERFQRRGIGARLVGFLLEHGRRLGCTEAWVVTEVGNTAARALYLAIGGEEDDEHAVVYTYPLGPNKP